jgi:hypothetical protein
MRIAAASALSPSAGSWTCRRPPTTSAPPGSDRPGRSRTSGCSRGSVSCTPTTTSPTWLPSRTSSPAGSWAGQWPITAHRARHRRPGNGAGPARQLDRLLGRGSYMLYLCLRCRLALRRGGGVRDFDRDRQLHLLRRSRSDCAAHRASSARRQPGGESRWSAMGRGSASRPLEARARLAAAGAGQERAIPSASSNFLRCRKTSAMGTEHHRSPCREWEPRSGR